LTHINAEYYFCDDRNRLEVALTCLQSRGCSGFWDVVWESLEYRFWKDVGFKWRSCP
jgi:hypothetical protein